MKTLSVVLLIGAIILGLTVRVSADVILSEVLYDVSGADGGYEWVELYNNGGTAVNLSNYSLGWGGANYANGTLQLSGTINPGSFFVVGGPNSDASNGNPTYDQTANFEPDIQNGGTESDGVALFNVKAVNIQSDTVPIDVVIYDSPNSNDLMDETGNAGTSDVDDAPAGSSIERTNISPDTWQIQSNPTPGSSTYESSLPVTLSSFTAIATDFGITLKWRTESEIGNLGFNIYRSEKKDGKFVKINKNLIPGAGNSAMPNSYQFVDKTAIKGREYYYYLEDVDVAGLRNKFSIISSKNAEKLAATWGRIKKGF